jgi:hypothetical protein
VNQQDEGAAFFEQFVTGARRHAGWHPHAASRYCLIPVNSPPNR